MKQNYHSNMPYIIAETAYSFEGNSEYLLKQVETASDAIDAIKFHLLIDIDDYMVRSHQVYNELKKWIISKEEWRNILYKTKKKGLDTLLLVDDQSSIDFCIENHELIDAVEIHAACVNDLQLLDKAIDFSNNFNKLFVLGISGFEIQELLDIKDYLEEKKLDEVLLMYGFQNYPTKISEVNLSKIQILSKILDYKIGYADHTEYSSSDKEMMIETSFTLGANVQEIHYVLEEGQERTDYVTAVNNGRLEEIKNKLMNIYMAVGNPNFKLNDGEHKYLDFRKVPLYKENFNQNQTFTSDMVIYKRVQNPTRQHKFLEINSLIGKRLKKSVTTETEVKIEDFE